MYIYSRPSTGKISTPSNFTNEIKHLWGAGPVLCCNYFSFFTIKCEWSLSRYYYIVTPLDLQSFHLLTCLFPLVIIVVPAFAPKVPE